MPGKHRTFFIALSTLSALIAGICGLLWCGYPRSVPPYDLATCCAALYYRAELAGTGFFIQTKGSNNNTYFVTALHTIKLIREIAGQDRFNIQAIVKRRDATGGTALTIPWDDAAFRPNGEPFDLAVMRIPSNLLSQANAYVTPLILEYDGVPAAKDTNKGMALDDNHWVYTSASEDIPSAIAAASRMPGEDQVHQVRAGQPGFLLFPARKKYGVTIGNDLFTLASQKYFSPEDLSEPFTIFLRTGVLAFCGVDGTDNGPSLSGESCKPFVIACQSSKGNSGAPVFLNIKTRRFDGSICVTPHLLGVLVGAVNAPGPTQTLNVAVCDMAGRPMGHIRDAPIFNENTGLSVVWPVDYLAQLLIEAEAHR